MSATAAAPGRFTSLCGEAALQAAVVDFVTQAQHKKAIGGQPDYALGSVPAITAGG